MYRPLKITFTLDGTGVYYDPFEPPMLDAIFCATLARRQHHGEPPARDERPFEYELPLKKWRARGTWGWHASALFPDPDCEETLVHWRKRLRQNRIEITQGSPNLTNGIYRDWNMPLPLLLTRHLTGWCLAAAHDGIGIAASIKHELTRSARWLGKKRAHGRGNVIHINVEHCEEDCSISRDGKFVRYMPQENGPRLVRPRPPYWNNWNRTPCAEIGERDIR